MGSADAACRDLRAWLTLAVDGATARAVGSIARGGRGSPAGCEGEGTAGEQQGECTSSHGQRGRSGAAASRARPPTELTGIACRNECHEWGGFRPCSDARSERPKAHGARGLNEGAPKPRVPIVANERSALRGRLAVRVEGGVSNALRSVRERRSKSPPKRVSRLGRFPTLQRRTARAGQATAECELFEALGSRSRSASRNTSLAGHGTHRG